MIPSLVRVVDGAMASDGGTVALRLVDTAGDFHVLRLTQHSIPQVPGDTDKPGRLYLDGVLLGIRSEDEGALLEFLRTAPIAHSEVGPAAEGKPHLVIGEGLNDYFSAIERGPDEALRFLIATVVSFVASDDYVALAAKVAGKADP